MGEGKARKDKELGKQSEQQFLRGKLLAMIYFLFNHEDQRRFLTAWPDANELLN